jgi:hypothetical protein
VIARIRCAANGARDPVGGMRAKRVATPVDDVAPRPDRTINVRSTSMPDTSIHPLRLDRSRYHSSEHGEFQSRVRYWQDGLPFDAVGELCTDHCSAEQLARADAKAPKQPQVQVPEQFGHPALDEFTEGLRTRIEEMEGEVNLELWAKGEARYVPAKVFGAIRERYSKSVSTFADAIEFLVNEAKLIPASQASKQLLTLGGATPVREEA